MRNNSKHLTIQIRAYIIFFIGLSLLLVGCEAQVSPTPTPELEPSPEMPTPTRQPTPVPSPILPQGETIAQIQGAGHISPFRNKMVSNVKGVVTVVQSDGFYLQSITPDDNPATSEGIFVFSDFVPSVRSGDEVMLNARVEEVIPGGGYGNLSITRLSKPEIEVLSRGNDLPDPTVIGEGGRIPPTEVIDDDTNGFISENTFFDPENDGIDFYESLEGMLVQVNDAVVVGPTNTYKEIIVLGDLGANASVRTPRGGIVVRENDFNPERIMLDDKLNNTPFVNVGDISRQPIVGVMDYDFGNFKIQVTSDIEFDPGGLSPSPALEPAMEGQLRVVSYNVLNLSAIEPDRITRLADQIVNLMAAPDIIGLQEIQDNDGSEGQDAISADLTYQGIIDDILELGGPRYLYVDIDPIPGSEGGINLGNIRQGFLYRIDRGLSLAQAPPGDSRTAVELSDQGGTPVLSLNPGRIDPTNLAFHASRRPLVVTFVYQGEPLFVINNHFNSKGEDRDLFGEFQPPLLDSEIQRVKQAQVVHDFVAELLEIDPNCRVIVLGDLNDFYFSTPIKMLRGNIMQNLIETLPVEERYTYIYEGNSQNLDHILITQGLIDSFLSLDIMHLNSEFDYVSRFSDHDPLVATFVIE
jgi:uncharacterized protein